MIFFVRLRIIDTLACGEESLAINFNNSCLRLPVCSARSSSFDSSPGSAETVLVATPPTGIGEMLAMLIRPNLELKLVLAEIDQTMESPLPN